MTTLREAAQQALEALNLYAEQYPHMVKGYTLDAENALRAALAEPDPPQLRTIINFLLGAAAIDGVYFGEPHPFRPGNYWWRGHLMKAWAGFDPTEQYSCPICAGAMVEWQGLTDEEIWTMVDDCKGSVPRFARAIEAALKEKNA